MTRPNPPSSARIPGTVIGKRKSTPAPQLSSWPFADGLAWDEELVRAGHRAVSTHGRWEGTTRP